MLFGTQNLGESYGLMDNLNIAQVIELAKISWQANSFILTFSHLCAVLLFLHKKFQKFSPA